MRRTHGHACQSCGESFVCDGELEKNHDGWPEVICLAYHEHGQQWCEACAADAPHPDAHVLRLSGSLVNCCSSRCGWCGACSR